MNRKKEAKRENGRINEGAVTSGIVSGAWFARTEACPPSGAAFGSSGRVFGCENGARNAGGQGVAGENAGHREAHAEADRIGSGAFAGCAKLELVTLPDGIREIGERAFSGCRCLKQIDFPAGMQVIGKEAFLHCTMLAESVLPPGVVKMETGAFRHCVHLKRIVLPQALRAIGEEAFAECISLRSLCLPGGVEEIGALAFDFCPLPAGLTADGENGAFYTEGNCLIRTADGVLIRGSENSVIPEGGSVREIGEAAFSGCGSLREIRIPHGVREIGANAFMYCRALESVIIGRDVERIGEGAFYHCTALREVRLEGKSRLCEIGDDAFRHCDNLRHFG